MKNKSRKHHHLLIENCLPIRHIRLACILTVIFCFASCSGYPSSSSQETQQKNTPRNTGPKIISDSTNTLSGKIETLELEYLLWGCACANWVTPADKLKHENGQLAPHCIFIEPADSSLNIPATFDPAAQKIQVRGQFYNREGYPKGTVQTEEPLEKAKVFLYTELRILDK